jgi:hypothetical protein
MMKTFSVILSISFLCLIESVSTQAFEIGTHAELSERAVRSSHLNDYLNTQLNILAGINNELSTNATIVDWVSDGGRREDRGTRFCNHFHNPLHSWDEAGLRIPLPLPVLCQPANISSVLWGQRLDLQPAGERFTWQDARQNFFQGTTAATQTEREARLADTFRALGQLVHLVQDAAVPAHARNDPHPIFEGLESFVENTRNMSPALFGQMTATTTRFDPSILTLLPNPLAPIPIARIIDTTDPEKADASPSAGTNVGMAEYSNANFLSGDTIFKDFTFPRVASLGIPVDGTDPVTGFPRSYYPKVADGQTGFRLAAKGVWTERLASLLAGDQGYVLDNEVHEDYARLLLPRAIGYSAGLIDYFFRGQIEIAPPARFAYGLAAFQAGNTGVFTKLRFKVRNATPGEDTGPGQMTAVVQYRAPITNESLIDNPFADISQQLFFAVSQPLQAVTLTPDFQEFVFDFTQNPLPTNSADLFLTVVYKGRLGLEDGAVMVGGKDLFEPDPLDVGNATDWECFQGTLHHVADSTAYPPYSPPGQTQRDVNQDGVQDLFGPALLFNQFVKTFDLTQPALPSETSFDFSTSQESFSEYGRLMLLQDQPSYGATVLTRQVQQIPSGAVETDHFRAAVLPAVFNNVVLGPSGELVRQVRSSSVYRGVPLQHGLFLVNQNTLPCLPQTQLLPPDLTRIEGALPTE